jgi:flagellar M-ring protein FliF
MNRDEVAGITRLVAGSVEGLKPDDVTVVSSEGAVLSLAGEAEGPVGLTSRQLAARQAVENYLTHKAQSLLESVVGPGKAVVRLDFEQLERSTERFDPAGRAIRSEERETEEGAESGTGNREHTIANYEVSKTVERILGAAGGVKRLSVAVVVDGTYAETPGPEGQPTRSFVERSPESLAEFGRMVRNAIGVDDKRGDVFEIACIALTSPAPPEEKPAVPAVILRDAGRYAPQILPVAGFVVLFLLLRRTLGGLTRSLPVSGTGARPSSAGAARGGEETDLDRDRRQLRERVEAIARERPEAAARLIRTWLLEKK